LTSDSQSSNKERFTEGGGEGAAIGEGATSGVGTGPGGFVGGLGGKTPGGRSSVGIIPVGITVGTGD